MKRIFRTIPALKGALIASKEGLPIISVLPQGTDEERVASITASLISVAERSIIEMGLGKLDNIYIKGSEGYIITCDVDPDTFFTVSLTRDVRLGLIFLDIRRFIEKIRSKGYEWMGDEYFPYPFIFKPPTPPGDLGVSGQAQLKEPTREEDFWNKPYCKYCGSIISKGQSICHVCKKRII